MTDKYGKGAAVLSDTGNLRLSDTEIDKNILRLRQSLPGFPEQVDPPNLNLAEQLLATSDWPVRHQYHRNTCIAFCAAAFVELTQHLQDGSIPAPDVSDEFLYSMISNVAFRDVVDHLTDEQIKYFNATGARFLAQAKAALTTGALVPDADMTYDFEDDTKVGEVFVPSDDLVDQASTTGIAGLTNMISLPQDGDLVVGPGRLWAAAKGDPGQTVDVVQTFLHLLQNKKPILAGFPILRGWHRKIWFGTTAFDSGHIVYPRPDRLADLSIEGGHSVCIVGYKTDPSVPGQGYFIFRNSFARNFADDLGETPAKKRPPEKGYGTISFFDVEFYCLEFLHG